ncbi:hypothetical protein NEIELOOT_01751 [Neisseria elongata subsp. glycolytica ATCC 29315]|uniref:Uncharacterized protein n=1 Tax=Neisseria elongata subsp. glycolytica ATCC 29315 TaxID=546263 RepID=D4DRQ8_NEIEG|nr:hypothetical protein NEIELOOT_01751 [Neisseria elongata subsp. glycolytica ATCC 29315]
MYAAAFVIDGDNQGRLAQGFDFLHEQGQLFSILEISAEQNHAADSGIKQAFFSSSVSRKDSTSAITGPRGRVFGIMVFGV